VLIQLCALFVFWGAVLSGIHFESLVFGFLVGVVGAVVVLAIAGLFGRVRVVGHESAVEHR